MEEILTLLLTAAEKDPHSPPHTSGEFEGTGGRHSSSCTTQVCGWPRGTRKFCALRPSHSFPHLQVPASIPCLFPTTPRRFHTGSPPSNPWLRSVLAAPGTANPLPPVPIRSSSCLETCASSFLCTPPLAPLPSSQVFAQPSPTLSPPTSSAFCSAPRLS